MSTGRTPVLTSIVLTWTRRSGGPIEGPPLLDWCRRRGAVDQAPLEGAALTSCSANAGSSAKLFSRAIL